MMSELSKQRTTTTELQCIPQGNLLQIQHRNPNRITDIFGSTSASASYFLQWKGAYWVRQLVYSVGFEPPWFPVLDRMNPGNSLEEECFSSDISGFAHAYCQSYSKLLGRRIEFNLLRSRASKNARCVTARKNCPVKINGAGPTSRGNCRRTYSSIRTSLLLHQG
jgi:hypothetical protein